MSHISVEDFRAALPKVLQKSVNQEVIDLVNDVVAEPEFIENFRDNLVGYHNILTQGKFRLSNYVEAVKYVSHKLMGTSNIDSYRRAFPQKIADFKSRNISEKDIATYVYAYNKSKLVNLIMAQSLIPTHVLNADVYQEAINIQLELARYANSEKVRSDAANSLLVQLRPPETKKIELDIAVKGDESVLTSLRETTMELVRQQKLALQSGAINAEAAAGQRLIIEGELLDD
jgi:hypothetical protein